MDWIIILLYLRFGVGIVCCAFGIVQTYREPRRFSNAVCLSLGLVLTIQGFMRIWEYFLPGLISDGSNEYVLTPAGDIRGLLTVAYLTLILLLGFWLMFNGIGLMRKERICLAHMLPFLFGIFCLVYCLFRLWGNFFLSSASENSEMYVSHLIAFLRSCALYVPFMVMAYFLYTLVYFLVRDKRYPDYIIVLGARVIDGHVSPLLAKRLDRGKRLYDKWEKTPCFVVSGGKGVDEICSEAKAMATYLMEKGVPAEQILLEDQSTNTHQNLLFSKQQIEHIAKEPYYCSIVTSEYHVLRSVVCARSIGLPCNGYGCRTARYYFAAAALREAAAFIFSYKQLALTAVGLFAANAIITLLLELVVKSMR